MSDPFQLALSGGTPLRDDSPFDTILDPVFVSPMQNE